MFHPHSKHDNTIIVLSTDSHLRVFELSLSTHVPEQDIPLFPSPRRGYTVDFDVPIPISFTFGAGDDWIKWAIFILTRDGDIFILCPIMPTKCVLPRSAITRMKALISYRAEILHSRKTCSLVERETCLNQTRWISDILGQISMGEFMGVTSSPAFTGVDTGDLVTFKRPNKVRPTPELQGPLLFQPAPQTIDSIFPAANDIAFLDVDGLGIAVTTWQGGRVDIGILIDGVEGVWSVKGVSSEELLKIKVATYESVDIPVPGDAWTGILTSHNDNNGVFIAAGEGVWQVDFRAWLHEMQKLNQENESEDAESFETKASITSLINKERYSLMICLLR